MIEAFNPEPLRPLTRGNCRLGSLSRGEIAGLFVLTTLAAAARFWRLGHPAALVFDEHTVIMQVGAYLRGWPFFLSLQPPLAKLLVAASIGLFGNGPYARRLPSALIGTVLVPANYLLTRYIFLSAFAASLAGTLTLCEGLLLIGSRVAMINIFAIAFSAVAYLALFCFRHTTKLTSRRRLILAIGVLLGCEIATKAGISEVTAILVTGFLLVTVWNERITDGNRRAFVCEASGILAMIGGLSAAIYVAAFLPYYHFGWWAGISDLIRYQHWIVAGNLALPHTSLYSSPAWSWPLMLRAFPYWSELNHDGWTTVVWCGGNPAIWWEILPALIVSGARAIKQRSISWSFPPIAYCGYMLIFLPLPRYLFIYDYMPMCEAGILAIAGGLTLSWIGEADSWEQILLLMPSLAVLVCALHLLIGIAVFAGILLIWSVLYRQKKLYAGRFVCASMTLLIAVVFAYFYPLWSSLPLSHSAYMQRMWFRGPGLANWM